MKKCLIILILAVLITLIGCQVGEPIAYDYTAESPLDYAEIIAELEAENERLRELMWDNGVNPDNERHPIDISFAEELEQPGSWATNTMTQITIEHAHMWRDEMEKYLALLSENLAEYDSAHLLWESQERWLTFAESDDELENEMLWLIYWHGTIRRPISAHITLSRYRNRALHLRQLYEQSHRFIAEDSV